MHTTRNTAAIPNYTARLAAFLEQKPSDEEMYRFLAEMDAEAHKWLAKHRLHRCVPVRGCAV